MSFGLRLGRSFLSGVVVVLVITAIGFCQSATGHQDTLGSVQLATAVKERIYRELAGEPGTSNGEVPSSLAVCPVKLLKIGPDGHSGLRVWGTSSNGTCGATGNCDIWVFDPKTGELLLSANGFDLRVEAVVHHGLFDIVTSHNMSAGSGVRDLYQFDGHEYQNVQETNETYQ